VLRSLRLVGGWGVSQFADEVGITKGYLSNIERGRRRGNPALLARMAEVLGVPLSVIATECEPQHLPAQIPLARSPRPQPVISPAPGRGRVA
jgi:transcriptional regulator with XRE-family HTH domain